MARIPDEELARLKREVPLATLVEASGVKLTRRGADLVGLCPLHRDTEPSLVLSPDKGLWHCLGACHRGGTVIDWVMATQKVSFRHAVELLREQGTGATRGVTVAKKSNIPHLPAPVTVSATDTELLDQVARYYHEQLLASAEAQDYLKRRSIDDADLVRHFGLGYSDRTLGLRLPGKKWKAGAELRGRLTQLGIYRESGHEHFAGSLTIPIFSETNHVVGMYGRKLRDDLRAGTPKHLYLPGPHRGVLNVEGLAAGGTVILCEALIDALSFWAAGFRNVTASYGVEGFGKDHVAAFRRHDVDHVLVAYDADEAGDRAAEALAARLAPEGMACSRVKFPRGMDANAYACTMRPTRKAFELVLKGATPMTPAPARPRPTAPRPPSPISAAATTTTAAPPPPAAPSPPHLAASSGPRPEPGPLPAQEPPAMPAASEGPRPNAAAATTPAATPAPATPAAPATSSVTPTAGPRLPEGCTLEQGDDEQRIRLGDRSYRVRGLAKNQVREQMRVNLLASRGEGYYVDGLDLYSARQRVAFMKEAAAELELEPDVVKKDLGTLLLVLEQLQDAQVEATKAPQETAVVLSDVEREEALALLKDPTLLERILQDFDRAGLVGEGTNKLVGYLGCVSRKLDEPLAIIVQSSSAAGKTALQEALLAFVPEEERVKYSALTGQSLFYMGGKNLKHKVLAVVEEEGAERATYALKLLQSEGELTIASTGKDPTTGRLVTQEYKVEGPVMILLTTTAVEIDDELQNRCIVLTVNEDREQTRAIHRLQRAAQTLEGLLARREREKLLRVHRNAQRLLRPLLVVNPYAPELTFLDDKTRTRRDHMKYLTLISAVALLHQYQRRVKTTEHDGRSVEYLEATLEDIAVANRLAHEVLGRSLDELAPQTRRLLLLVHEMVARESKVQRVKPRDVRFTRRQVREATGWSDSQLQIHLKRLEELEYLLVHRALRGNGFIYELLYDGKGEDDAPYLPGLLDVDGLRGRKCDGIPLGPNKASFGVGGASSEHPGDELRPSSPHSEAPVSAPKSAADANLHDNGPEALRKAHLDEGRPSYVKPRRTGTPTVDGVN